VRRVPGQDGPASTVTDHAIVVGALWWVPGCWEAAST
jgi:hypothetical protein